MRHSLLSRARALLSERSLWIAQLCAIALVQVAVCGVLRLIWLARPDPFGSALVGKIDWYWFHALALDSWQAFRVVAVAVLIGLVFGQGERTVVWLRRIATGALIALTVLAVIDGEVMRFLGMHLSPTLIATYASSATVRELPLLLGKDAGGPFLGVVLLLLAPLAVGWLSVRAAQRVRSFRPAAWFSGLVGAGCLFAFVLWPGGFRQWRLSPPMDVIYTALTTAAQPRLADGDRKSAAERHAARWTSENGLQPSRFLLSEYPLFHATDFVACERGLLSATICAQDNDGDGVALAQDCDDHDPAIHPQAQDREGDGIDQDCSGADRRPVNVVLFILETHRALNVGHLFPDSMRPSATPRLDQLAAHGVTFTRAVANGTPTINAFMALHTSLLPHPSQTVASSFTHTGIHGLPEILREHGYYTRFFSAADPAWDNQTAWLRKWYDDVDYDRSREQDGPLFEHVAEWFDRTQPGAAGKPPFFVAITTRTNHYPFHRIEGVGTTGPDTLQARIADTMRYTDRHMGALLDRLAKEPWWKDTVVIVTGDHGFPMGEHGYQRLHETAHIEATGVPIVLAGQHPKLAPLSGKQLPAAVSHIDIAPTVLDLAGIDPSGSFMGHSLLELDAPRDSVVIVASEWAMTHGDKRLLLRPGQDAQHADQALWYDRLSDPRELHALDKSTLTQSDRDAERALRVTPSWMAYLYEHDRLWPSDPATALEGTQAHVSIQAP